MQVHLLLLLQTFLLHRDWPGCFENYQLHAEGGRLFAEKSPGKMREQALQQVKLTGDTIVFLE
jgi:hypothetical protein